MELIYATDNKLTPTPSLHSECWLTNDQLLSTEGCFFGAATPAVPCLSSISYS